MGYCRLLLFCVIVAALLIKVDSFYGGFGYGYNPCKSGYFLRNPYTKRPFYCGGKMRFCPWPRFYKCESMTGSDDGWGVCCFDMGDI